MGACLQKPVKSLVVKRRGGASFRVGFAEMNGWRNAMEDANVIFPMDDWGFFGVFDGHGGDQCSNHIARKLEDELEKGMPKDDAQMKEIALRLDQDFLDEALPSGSTGTFTIVETPKRTGGDWKLRVGNIGDSRVLLGGIDGKIVPGSGTDLGLTTDHKPDHPVERERIERTGGYIQVQNGGVSRVNGDLAVSRAFGDAEFKKTGGPGPEDHPVTADPEFCTLTCRPTDFVMLVCDGIVEGEFSNSEVVELAAQKLREKDPPDPADAACAVCRMALDRGSKDNLSCMIVLLGGGEIPGPELTLLPGPFECPAQQQFRKAYEYMAKHANLTLAEAVSRRYDLAKEELRLAQGELQHKEEMRIAQTAATGDDGDDENIEMTNAIQKLKGSINALQQEIASFDSVDDGPPVELAPGSAERTEWFEAWLQQQVEKAEREAETGTRTTGSTIQMGGGRGIPLELLQVLSAGGDVGRMLQMLNHGRPDQATARRKRMEVCVSPDELRIAFEESPGLDWEPKMEGLCGQSGMMASEDETQTTMQVVFNCPGFANESIWLPTSCLREVACKFSVQNRVRIASYDKVHEAVEEHKGIPWDDKMSRMCDQEGTIEEIDDSDDSAKVKIIGLAAWLPFSVLTPINDDDESTTASSDSDR